MRISWTDGYTCQGYWICIQMKTCLNLYPTYKALKEHKIYVVSYTSQGMTLVLIL